MPGFFDPQRPRLGNGKPAWLTCHMIALPWLDIEPLEESPDGDLWFHVSVFCGSSQAHATFPSSALQAFLHNWHNDPEDTMREVFGREPPTRLVMEREERVVGGKKQGEVTQTVNKTAGDLGL